MAGLISEGLLVTMEENSCLPAQTKHKNKGMLLRTMSLQSLLQSHCLAEYADHSRHGGRKAHFLRLRCGITSERVLVTKDPFVSNAAHK